MSRVTSAEAGLVSARIALGVFFVFEGWDKLPWVSNPGEQTSILNRWSEGTSSLSKWYLDHVALPGARVFARLVFFGEMLAGLALILGFWTSATAAITFLMVLNLHPVIGGKRLPLSLTKRK